MKRVCTLLGVIAIALLLPTVVWGQATAQITGSVKDQTGAVLPGAEISATQTDTGLVRNALTDETGSYILQNLPLGPYRVEVGLPGFKTFVQSGVALQVNSNPVINAVLEVGQVSEQVEVQANAAMVETRSSGVGQLIENERILELPLNGRQVTDLITLSGAAVTGTTGVASQQMQGTVGISVAGGTTVGVAYALDGALHNTPWSASNLPFPFPDALQEFKVETGGLSAQNGMRSGASVNSVTKSGTNEFHGNLFEFVRNNKFNGRNAFAALDDGLKRNQFGGTIGGPIVENKLFFFGGYQQTITRQRPTDEEGFVPTDAMLAGDFTTITSPLCRSTGQLTLALPFQNNRIDPSQFSPAARNLAAKLPKTTDPCGRIRFGYPIRSSEWQAVGRMDYQLSANNSIFGRYIGTTYKSPPPYELLDNLLATQRSGFDNLSQAFAVGNTYLLGANTVNSVRLAINRNALQRTHKDYFSGADLGVKMFDGYLPDYMILTVTGGPSLGGGTQNKATFRTTTYQIAEDLSMIRGSHQMAFGTNIAHWRNNVNANVASAGSFNFNGTATNLGMADFLTGRLTTLTQAAPNVVHDQQWYFGFYGQDTWRATPRVTLNYGLRWEPWFPAQIVDGRIYHFDEDKFRAGVKSTVFINAPAGFSYPGDPDFPGQAGMNERWWNFGPRVGVAWDVSGDGLTSVRASFSRAYDFVPGQFHINTVIANPWGARIVANSPSGGFDDPWTIPGGNPFPFAFDKNAAFALNGTYNNFNYESKTTTVDAWSLAIQRQLSDNWLVSTSYIGNHTIHLWTSRETNPAEFYAGSNCTLPSGRFVQGTCSTTGNTHDRRIYVNTRPDGQYIGSIGLFEDGGTAKYNGLLLSVQRRAARGVSVSANYTWSHCYGDVTQVTGTPNGGTFVGDRKQESGNCDTDRRHLFNSTAVVDTPTFTNPTVRALATGWKISGIFRKSTGSYQTITSGTDIARSGIGNQRPNQVLEDPYGDKDSVNRFLNPQAFVTPAIGSVGNMKRMNVTGPSTFQFDMALSRSFQIRETQRVEVRAEAFNVTNSFRRSNPSTALNSATFGQITSAQDPRIMQFALKYVF